MIVVSVLAFIGLPVFSERKTPSAVFTSDRFNWSTNTALAPQIKLVIFAASDRGIRYSV